MTKIFNNVQASEAGNVTTKVQKMDNASKIVNAEKMETKPDILELAENQANKLFEKLAFSCFIQSLKANVKADANRQTLVNLYIRAYRLTKGFTVILTESENKDGVLKEFTKVNGKVFWHKPLPQTTPHFYFASLKSGIKVAKQFAILERKREKVLSFEQLFATKYAQIANILTPEQKEQIYKSYLDGLNINRD